MKLFIARVCAWLVIALVVYGLLFSVLSPEAHWGTSAGFAAVLAMLALVYTRVIAAVKDATATDRKASRTARAVQNRTNS